MVNEWSTLAMSSTKTSSVVRTVASTQSEMTEIILPNDANTLGNLLQQFVGAIARPVVDQDQLKTAAHLLHHLLQARIQNGHVLLFIVKRNNDRIFRHVISIDARSVN